MSTPEPRPLLPPPPSFRCTALACKKKYAERQYRGLLTIAPGAVTFAPTGTSANYPLLDRLSAWLLNVTSGVQADLGAVHTEAACALMNVRSGYYRSWRMLNGDPRYGYHLRVLVALRPKHHVPDALRWAGFTVTEEQSTKDGLVSAIEGQAPAT